MKKSDIATHVADKTSVSKGDAAAAVTAVLGAITDALARGESVSRTMPVVESVMTAAQLQRAVIPVSAPWVGSVRWALEYRVNEVW